MADFSPVHFVPSSRKNDILASPVTRVLAVAHENLGHTNHWCFYISTSASTSVRFDCQPSHTIPSTVLSHGSKANLIISELPLVLPPEAEAHFPLDVAPGLTVARIYNLITDIGRHLYEFDADGVGCRCWVTDQLDLLHQAGLITSGSQVADAKKGILKLWPQQTPNPLDQGAYYQ